jgi:protein-glutamine gamma-glutamyltransferase
VAVNGAALRGWSPPGVDRIASRWRQLPREARDTLFLLAVIGWTVLPHAGRLPMWCSALTVAVLGWRARLALANAALPGRWALVGVLLGAAGLTFWSFGTLLGKEPGVAMIVTLMALKTLELRARRDAFVVFFLGFFLVLTHFFYSQSLAVAAAMLVAVWGLLTALVLAHMPVGQPSLAQAAKLAGRTAALGAPLMALMFVLFPRVAPLWGVPQDGPAKSGLAATMRMGSFGETVLDDSIALRIRFDGAVPEPAQMYFRGPVLTRFDGDEWRPLTVPERRSAPRALRTAGAPIGYEMTLEPQRLRSLPLLEASVDTPRIEGLAVTGMADLEWLVEKPTLERLRFHATAYPRFQHGPLADGPALERERELPPGRNPRTHEWAAALRRTPTYAEANADVLARAVLQHIRDGGYRYTLTPGGSDDGAAEPNAVDDFWFDRKAGFCEHFAAAFVVVMRTLDVPARVVTGYQGTDALPVDGYYLVRQSSAHAWAEYWQAGVGWVRADPTAAVAPDRIERGRRLASPPGLVADALGSVSPALLARLRSGWETMNNRWNQWVLGYSRAEQFDVLRALGFEAPSWDDLARLTVAVFGAMAVGSAGWAWWDRHRVDPWTRQMERLRQAVRSLGLPAAPHDTARALAMRLGARHGPAAAGLVALLSDVEQRRYGTAAHSRPDAGSTRRFVAAARALRWAAPR